MLEINRTDLAVERHALRGGEGVSVKKKELEGVEVCELCIETDEAQMRLEKPKGRYITLSAPQLLYDTEVYLRMCSLIAESIVRLAGRGGSVLVAGLGNRDITPDALGPEVVSRVFVTNHIKAQLEYDFVQKLGRLSALAPGVLGTTGIETARIIRGVVKEQKPDYVIAVDAYAAKSLSRISTTVQISDTGMTPGGGVGNRRAGINRDTLGVPVIAVGVPTVVDAATLAADMLGDEDEQHIRERLGERAGGLVVTPKDIDLVIDRGAKTVANGINLAAHPNLTIEEIESYVG